ncbi:MAG: hypothetical protein JKY56_08210 [Kofleriaceae bacterium]|nr:hypothetical protein [Kofleriaceae bacterium]
MITSRYAFFGIVFLAACTGGDGTATDGSVSATDSAASETDAVVGITDASGLDARGSVEDGSVIATDANLASDAMTMPGDDASVGTDAGPPGLDGGVQPLAVCIDACDVINTCSGGMGGGDLQGCQDGCTADLQDCSTKQLSAVETCVVNPPGIQCQALIICFQAIACIQDI